MKKMFVLVAAIMLLSCSTDSDEIKQEIENGLPQINIQTLSIDEHAAAGSSVGTITTSNFKTADLTFSINGESGLEIDEALGEITLGNTLILDYEVEQSLPFTVSVFDGNSIVTQAFELSINDINEFDLLSAAQRETIVYFQYLTLWQASTNNSLENSSRWNQPMKLYLEGQITAEFKADIEVVLAEYNVIFANSAFSISLVNTLAESNAHLFYGEAADIEGLWDDMFEIIDGQAYAGYAITANNSAILSDARMWVSSTQPILFKHEIGHALGFGHSNKCDTEKSFLCSTLGNDHDFLVMEEEIISYAYDNDMAAGLSADEIKIFLANKMFLEN